MRRPHNTHTTRHQQRPLPTAAARRLLFLVYFARAARWHTPSEINPNQTKRNWSTTKVELAVWHLTGEGTTRREEGGDERWWRWLMGREEQRRDALHVEGLELLQDLRERGALGGVLVPASAPQQQRRQRQRAATRGQRRVSGVGWEGRGVGGGVLLHEVNERGRSARRDRGSHALSGEREEKRERVSAATIGLEK
jgi:hypothetical protein